MYYYSDGNNQLGPLPIDELKGKINRETLVWKEGMPQWIRAADIEELENILPPPLPNSIKIAIPETLPQIPANTSTDQSTQTDWQTKAAISLILLLLVFFVYLISSVILNDKGDKPSQDTLAAAPDVKPNVDSQTISNNQQKNTPAPAPAPANTKQQSIPQEQPKPSSPATQQPKNESNTAPAKVEVTDPKSSPKTSTTTRTPRYERVVYERNYMSDLRPVYSTLDLTLQLFDSPDEMYADIRISSSSPDCGQTNLYRKVKISGIDQYGRAIAAINESGCQLYIYIPKRGGNVVINQPSACSQYGSCIMDGVYEPKH